MLRQIKMGLWASPQVLEILEKMELADTFSKFWCRCIRMNASLSLLGIPPLTILLLDHAPKHQWKYGFST
jgi:hypothetical protein